MRLRVIHSRTPRHTDVVSSIGWTNSEEMLSIGDDHKMMKWNTTTMDATTVAELPNTFFPTSLHWFPRTTKGPNDTFAVTTSDGKLHLMNKVGKIDKSVDAHRGAALSCKWSQDGTGLITCGEDGCVKMWSRNGMLRSVLAQFATAVYCCAWDSSSSRVLYCNGDSAYVKSLKLQVSPMKWKAHDGVILCCDWSPIGDHIVTGGEDCKFKVWDSFGRLMFSSATHDFPMTSISWSPDGQLFAVGSYNILRLCDKAGWSHSLEKLSIGSFTSLTWSPDGTQLAGTSAGAHVIHAHLVEKRVTYRNLDVVQTKPNSIEVRDMSSDIAKDKLETRDRITRISIAFEYLIVITTNQIYIFSSKNWNTPVITDLKEKAPSMILQCGKLFLVADSGGLYIFNYDGRNLCEIKPPGTSGASVISSETTALSNDTLAIRDRTKTQGDAPIIHDTDILELTIAQCGSLNGRIVAFRDRNSNIFISQVKTFGVATRTAKLGGITQLHYSHEPEYPVFLGSLAEQLMFNDDTNMLAGIGDGKIVVWPAPSIVFIDRSLLTKAVIEKTVNQVGKFPSLLNFTSNYLVIRRSDGSLLPVLFPPFASSLLKHLQNTKWDQAIRLCRQIQDDSLWAVLAGMATEAKNLYAAEIAYGALNEGEKVVFLAEARNESNKEVRNAMFLMLAGRIGEAESSLERSGHSYRALMLNVKMFRWSRALDIALKNKKHLEIVLGYRQKYLDEFNKKETDQKYLKHMGDVEVDWEHIREVVAEEEAKLKDK